MCFACDSWERVAANESHERLAAFAAAGMPLPTITGMICPVCDRSIVATVRDAELVGGVGVAHWAEARARYRAENFLPIET
jgi:hypothetical protein